MTTMKMVTKLLGQGAEALAEQRQVRVICSTEAQDRAGDIVVQKGIDLTGYQANPVVLWQHDPDQPIARAVDIGITEGKLQALVQFPPEGTDATSDRCYGLIKAGVLNATSIGFLPLEDEPVDAKKPWAGKRFLKSELMEFSFVSVPCNTGAAIVARSAEGGEGAAEIGGGTAAETAAPETKTAPRLTRKGLYTVGALASLLAELGWIADMAAYEADYEGDGSAVPAMLADALRQLGEALVAMTAEEVAELLATLGGDEDETKSGESFAAGLAAGRVLAPAHIKALADTHAAIGAHLKAVLGTAPQPAPAAPAAAPDDAAAALRRREAEALRLI